MKTARTKEEIMASQEKRRGMFLKPSIYLQSTKEPLIITNESELESYAKEIAEHAFAEGRAIEIKSQHKVTDINFIAEYPTFDDYWKAINSPK